MDELKAYQLGLELVCDQWNWYCGYLAKEYTWQKFRDESLERAKDELKTDNELEITKEAYREMCENWSIYCAKPTNEIAEKILKTAEERYVNRQKKQDNTQQENKD